MSTIVNMNLSTSTQVSAGDSDLTYGTGPITWDDATWILTSSFIIFTMQSGFGLLEAGVVTSKNEVNIMVKNAADVIFGGLSYWMIGFGLSFGVDEGVNPFCGVGYFFVDSSNEDMGLLFATFVFQLSFATTATTIVSGAMAERTKLSSYIIFSFLNTIIYCIPAHWIWSEKGFLYQLGCVDIAGSGGVHLVGGVAAFVAAGLLKPRMGRYDNGIEPLPMGNAVNTIIGLFMLWWGWLGFNCGSTFGISGGKWKLAAKAAVVTLNGSMGGGAAGIIYSVLTKKGKYDVGYIVNSVLGGLVSITAGCAIIRPWESIIIGVIGGILAIVFVRLIDKIKVDDPVGAVSIHGICGMWGLLSVGLFGGNDTLENLTKNRYGLFHGGGFYLLGIQTLAVVCLVTWTSVMTLLILLPLKYTIGLRLSPSEEILGADVVEHSIVNEPVTTNILFSSRSNSLASVGRQMRLEHQRRAANAQLANDLRKGIENVCFEDEPGPSVSQSSETIDLSTKPSCIKSRETTDQSNTKTNLVRFLRSILLENKDSQIKELEHVGIGRRNYRSNSVSSVDISQHTVNLDNLQNPCSENSQHTLF